jgi:hypothetical protein
MRIEPETSGIGTGAFVCCACVCVFLWMPSSTFLWVCYTHITNSSVLICICVHVTFTLLSIDSIIIQGDICYTSHFSTKYCLQFPMPITRCIILSCSQLREANSSSQSQQIHRHWRNLKSRYREQMGPPLLYILSQIGQVHNFTGRFLRFKDPQVFQLLY